MVRRLGVWLLLLLLYFSKCHWKKSVFVLYEGMRKFRWWELLIHFIFVLGLDLLWCLNNGSNVANPLFLDIILNQLMQKKKHLSPFAPSLRHRNQHHLGLTWLEIEEQHNLLLIFLLLRARFEAKGQWLNKCHFSESVALDPAEI